MGTEQEADPTLAHRQLPYEYAYDQLQVTISILTCCHHWILFTFRPFTHDRSSSAHVPNHLHPTSVVAYRMYNT